jgi:hypothetical protein
MAVRSVCGDDNQRRLLEIPGQAGGDGYNANFATLWLWRVHVIVISGVRQF